jgi:hypothetical protein
MIAITMVLSTRENMGMRYRVHVTRVSRSAVLLVACCFPRATWRWEVDQAASLRSTTELPEPRAVRMLPLEWEMVVVRIAGLWKSPSV